MAVAPKKTVAAPSEAVLSVQEVEAFIGQYYGLLIEDQKVRERLIQVARSVVRGNIADYGSPTAGRLQQTLEEVLDNHLPKGEGNWPVSLQTDLTGTGFTLEQVLAAPDEQTESEAEAELERGERLLEVIRHSLREDNFQSLVTMSGGADNLVSILSSTSLTPKDVSSAGKLKEVIRWLSGLPPEARELYANYSIYQRQRASGDSHGRSNPIRTLDSTSSQIVQRIVRETYERRKQPFLLKELRLLGFRALLARSHGLSGIVRATAPELFHKIPQIPKWTNGQESVNTALTTIQEALYSLPDYREAEETGDREAQVRIINKWVTQGKLVEYLNSHGLGGLVKAFLDVTGEKGIRKPSSPKAVLEFYNERKGLGWFDRAQQTYVQGWRIQENGMWTKGEQSVQLALEAIQDALRSLPGFRRAEDAGNRDEQVRIINQFITQTAMADFFAKAGLSGLMQRFVDPEGRVGIKKEQSPKALLDFYSTQKGLGWFDRAQPTHVGAWRIKEQGMWKSGEESAQLAVEAIEDVLYILLSYREAEQADRREEQLRILNQLLQQRGRQKDYFQGAGLTGLIGTLVDPKGRTGPKKSSSVSALLEFYSQRKGLEWFSTAYPMHLAVAGSGRLVVIDKRPQLSDAAKKFSEGISLEEIVSALSDEFGVSGRHRELGLSFLNSRLGWLAGRRVYDAVTENVIRDELQQFYYERGIVPINTAEGPKRVKRVKDLRLLRASQAGILLSKEERHDAAFFRHYKRIVERSRRGAGPSRAEMIDQHGQMEELRSYYGRPVSYDDVLPVTDVMRRYQTGQRAIIIRIGEKQVAMIPETVDDLWVLNPSFIKLRINGVLVNEKLYYFWRRAESDGISNGEGSSKDGSEPPWHALFNHEGRHKDVVAYLGTASTWEAVASNPKAKFIKHGALPSRELVRLGVLAVTGRRGRRARGEASEEAAGTSKTRTGDKLKYAPAHVSFEEFSGYVPRDQLAETEFEDRLRKEIRQKGAPNIARVMQLAEEVGLRATQGRSVEVKIRKVISGEEYVILAKRGSDPKNPDEYVGLKKFSGEKGTPIRQVLYSALEKAAQELNTDYSPRATHQMAGGVIGVLQGSNVETKGDLENLLQSGWSAIQAVEKLVNVLPQERERLACFLRACQIIGYDVPPEAVAASPLKYWGKDSKPVKDDFRPYVEEAVREANSHFNPNRVNQVTGQLIYGVLESNGIVFMLDLEGLLQRGNEAILGLKGLVSKDPSRKHALYDYFVRACELAHYEVGNGTAAAAISAPAAAAQATS